MSTKDGYMEKKDYQIVFVLTCLNFIQSDDSYKIMLMIQISVIIANFVFIYKLTDYMVSHRKCICEVTFSSISIRISVMHQ